MLLLLLLPIRASLGSRQEEESVTASGKVEVLFVFAFFVCVFVGFYVMFVFNVMLGWWVVVMVAALPRWLGP